MLGAVPCTARILPSDMRKAEKSPQDGTIRLRFADTDVSDVLQALALRTHANIVFPAELKKPVSLNVTATTPNEALRYITAAAGLVYRQVGQTYIVAPPADMRQALEPFGERTTVALNTLTPDEAVKLLEGALPFLTARPAGNQVLLIGAREDIVQAQSILADQDKPHASDPTVNEVVVIQHAPASQLASMLKNMYPSLRADVVGPADKPGGAIGLSGPRSQVENAKQTINSVDVPTEPRGPERVYRIYNIKYGSAPNLQDFLKKAAPDLTVLMGPETFAPPKPTFNPISAVNLGSSTTGSSGGSSGGGAGGAGGTGGATGGSGTAGANGVGQPKEGDKAKTLVISGPSAEVDEALRLLEQIDVAPKQVMVDVKVVDTSPENAENIGVTWSWTPFSFLEVPQGSKFTGSGTQITDGNTIKPVPLGALSRVPWTFQAALNAMVTRKEAKLLADPKVQVLDNEDANIFIGDTIRTTVSQASITGTTIQVLEFPIGIILLVHPRINADGNLTLRVHPVVSSVTSINAGLPQTSSREAETTVMVKDGETIVIGGLIRDEMSKTVQEVPLLSKLPIIGALFRNRSVDHRHSDILVFITPHVVK